MTRTILIIASCEEVRKTLEADLSKEYQILDACGGQDGLQIIKRRFKSLSAIVVYIGADDAELFDFLRDKQCSPLLLQIPLIVCMSYSDGEVTMKAVRHGANCVIALPDQRKMLNHYIRNVISLRENSALTNSLRRDRLTNLLNKEAFLLEAEKELFNCLPGKYVMSCIDIENFKIINDQCGTEIGDAVLQYVGREMDNCTKQIGGVSCRFSMDRFAMLYPVEYMDSEMLKEVRERTMNPPFIDTPIRIRVGRYIMSDNNTPVIAAYDRASLAQKSIKGLYDTNVAMYNSTMREKLYHEETIIRDMRKDLRNGKFETWFQPLYNHETGALIGAEALVRWRKDDMLIMPGDFIPIFEKNGFIYEMDQYIWHHVCAQQRRWIGEGKQPVPISVNVSRADLTHEDVVNVISSLLEEFELPINMIRLEITESVLAEIGSRVRARVNELINMGFVVEIDDFGSGYSSLNTLKDIPAQILKLDMGFVGNSPDYQRSTCIMESIVNMAKRLGMVVIAEGVEEKAQADFQKSIGCHYIQGYYYSKPMPGSDYERVLQNSTKETRLTL